MDGETQQKLIDTAGSGVEYEVCRVDDLATTIEGLWNTGTIGGCVINAVYIPEHLGGKEPGIILALDPWVSEIYGKGPVILVKCSPQEQSISIKDYTELSRKVMGSVDVFNGIHAFEQGQRIEDIESNLRNTLNIPEYPSTLLYKWKRVIEKSVADLNTDRGQSEIKACLYAYLNS